MAYDMSTTPTSRKRSRRWTVNLHKPEKYDTTTFLERFDNESVPNVKRCFVFHEICPKSGAPHWQAMIEFVNAKSRSALDKWSGFHWSDSQPSSGTSFENYNYCSKDGNPVIEYGDIPLETGEPSTWEKIRLLIENGLDNFQIAQVFPFAAIRCHAAIEKYRLEYELKNPYWRDVVTTYMSGDTGTGKTRFVMEKYGYSNVYRITNYKNPFDQYRGQDVIVFEEFRNSIKIEQMLNYLDGYPLELPCRYADRLAKFTKVYIITNWDLSLQYQSIQENHEETFNAFLRRLDFVIHMSKDNQKEIEYIPFG